MSTTTVPATDQIILAKGGHALDYVSGDLGGPVTAVLVQRPGQPERRAECPWCAEPAGWCRNADGPHPCEGEGLRVASAAELARTPFVGTFRVGVR
jgi:hypothetical protein